MANGKRLGGRRFDVRVAVAIFGAVAVLLAAYVGETSYHRVRYPYELSVMEGGFLAHAQMVASGREIYGPPSAEFIPFLYTPLYHYFSGALLALGVPGFVALRMVSIAGILAATLMGMVLTRKAADLRWIWLSVPVLVLARYFDVQAYYDQGRPDNLMTAFCLLAVWGLTLERPSRAISVFAIAATLATYTKQSAVVFLAVLLGTHLLIRARSAVLCTVAWSGLSAGVFLALTWTTDGWFARYIVGVSASHSLDLAQLVRSAAADLAGSFGIVTVAVVVAALALVSQGGTRPSTTQEVTRVVLLHAALAALVFTAVSLLQPFVVKNVLVLYAVVGSVFLPVALDWAVAKVVNPARAHMAVAAAMAILTITAGAGIKERAAFAADDPLNAERWGQLRRLLESYGPLERAWTIRHGSPWNQGPAPPVHVHLAALLDYHGGRFSEELHNPLPPDLEMRLREHYYAVILVPAGLAGAIDSIAEHYTVDSSQAPVRLPALSGYAPGQEYFWIPKRASD
jgi:hypothetical protein